MRKFLLIFLLLARYSSSAIDRNIDSIFVALDNAILHKQAYNRTAELELSVLREKLHASNSPGEKIENTLMLGSAWLAYQNDSAMHYAAQADRLALAFRDERSHIEAQILRAGIFRAMGQFIESSWLLDQLQGYAIPGDMKYKYFDARRLNCNSLRGYSVSAREKELYESTADRYRDSLLNDPFTPEAVRFIVKLERLYSNEEYNACLDLALANYDAVSPDDLGKDPGILDFYISDLYGRAGDHDSELFYLAKAAIEDIKHSSRSYVSLRKLSRYLYQSEEVDRAYNYMKCHIDDAVAGNERFRLFESANFFLDINKAFQKKELKQKKTITTVMTLLAIAVLFLAGAIINVMRQRSIANSARMDVWQSNQALTKANARLKDANHIKTEYIRLYMEQHINYLSKIEHCKKKARKIALVNGGRALLDFVESSMDTHKELDHFYEHFDATVLNLFPNFIEEFNALLMPDRKEILKNARDLTPGLRIFALVRLGISNSNDIARFLQYSLSTIYTYRTRMRNRAISRNSFEKQVMKIGITTL
jgi:hypothetical protein